MKNNCLYVRKHKDTIDHKPRGKWNITDIIWFIAHSVGIGPPVSKIRNNHKSENPVLYSNDIVYMLNKSRFIRDPSAISSYQSVAMTELPE